MNSLPDKINLGLMELLSVLLPGALFICLLNQIEFFKKIASSFSTDTEGPEWQQLIVYFGITYFLGYVLYTLSTFMDEWYKKLKMKAIGKEADTKTKRLEKKEVKWWMRALMPNVHHTHNLVYEVIDLKEKYLDASYKGEGPIDAFQWSYRFLMLMQPLMFSEVERYYSTARFFRSMTLVLFIGALIFLMQLKFLTGIIFLLIACMSFWLFLNRWQKANHVAFKNAIILDGEANQKSKG